MFVFSDCCNKLAKFSGLKQHKYIILQFHSLEVQNGSHCDKIKVLARQNSPLEALEVEREVSLACPASSGCLHRLAHGLLCLSLKPTTSGQVLMLPSLWFCLFCLPLPLLRTLVITLACLNNVGLSLL